MILVLDVFEFGGKGFILIRLVYLQDTT
jgi:hypothetical protein